MATLPGGFSPVQAFNAAVLTPFTGNNYDVLSETGSQINGQPHDPRSGVFWVGQDGNTWYSPSGGTARNMGKGVDLSSTAYRIDDPNSGGSTTGQQAYDQGNTPGALTGTGGSKAINKAGLNTAIAGLESQLNTLNPQENVAKANILNQFQTSKNRLDTGYNVGQGNLTTSERQVNAAKERSLKNLRDSILMQSQGYANQLGAFGAGDSSAAGMINYALGQQGARERGNVLEEAGAQLTGIQRQREDLERNYQNQVTDLENWKNTKLSDIVTNFQAMRNEINNKIVDARARSFAEQNLVNQAVQELQNLENNYRTQAEQMNQLYANALAPQNIQIDPSLQQYQVQALSPTQLESLRMPTAVNPEAELTALLRRRDEENRPILSY